MRIVKIFGSFSLLHFVVFYISAVFLPCVLLDPLSLNEPNLDIQHTSASSENLTNTSTDQGNPKEPLTAETSQTEIILETKVPKEQDLKLQYSEVISQSSGVEKEIINNDTPVAVSQVDSATKEFQENVPPLSSDGASQHEGTQKTNVSHILPGASEEEINDNITISVSDSEKHTNNLTDKVAEDIPSFSEWAQKQLEEVEKKEQSNFSTPTQQFANTTKPGSAAKLRWKNYASVDCGAKAILANSEGKNSWAILSPSRDEYKLDPCNSRIWFIVELCEAIQLKKIDIANYELFSSSPKEFTVSVSDRFPTRDWSIIGNFEAKDERDVQSFDISTDTFGKYVKVEIKSHYGSEHYCPLSLFRAYGTNVFEVLQKDDPAHEQPIEDDDDDDEALDNAIKNDGQSGNILSSATDAVLSMVKKAAQVLGNKVTNDSSQLNNGTSSEISIMKSCSSPSHYVVCNNCSDLLFGKIFELLSCKQEEIKNLVRIPFVKQSLISSEVCKSYGFHLGDKSSKISLKTCPECVVSFFPPHYIGAMCNVLATIQNKVLYNTSYQYVNITEPTAKEVLSDMEEESKINLTEIDSKQNSIEYTLTHQPTEPLNVDQSNINSKASYSTDITYTSKIKPSKSLVTELPEHSELNTASANIEEAAEQVNNVEQQEDPDVSNVEPTLVESTTEVLLEVETTESSGEDNMDKMMTDFSSEPSPVVNTANAATLQGQKESVFLRLSNRIKALERNMSLSGQYLEELSKRYKKQVEEMQRVLEKTENTLKKVTEKDEERLKQLEDKIDSLTVAVESLLSERDSWKVASYWLFFAGGVVCLIYCYQRCSTPKSTSPVGSKHAQIQRRNSTDSVIRQSPKKKKRRPSDQALKIVTTAASGDQERSKKRRKKSSIQTDSLDSTEKFLPRCTSSKIWLPKSQSADWVESRKVIEDIPFVLDECDNSTLEPLPFTTEVEVIKVPPFVNTATNARLNRSFKSKKSQSVEETRSRQPSPVSSITGSVSSGTERTPKKEKKGFKKLFKRVF